jgi:nucleotide-binding universal stress UspA family protein
MIRSILVPLDGSEFGEGALPLAMNIARHANATVHVAHVHVPLATMYAETMVSMESTLDPELKEQEKAYVERIARDWGGKVPFPVVSHLLEGPVAESILEFVAGNGIDLVVMTTHGRGAFSRFWLGSVADELVRRLPVPVLLVRPTEGEPEAPEASAVRHIMIPLDGTPLGERILEPATELGRMLGADFTLLRVVAPVTAMAFDPAGVAIPNYVPAVDENLAVDARAYLDRVAESLRRQGFTVNTAVAIGQPAGQAILDEARDDAMDLIAMETHGRKGLTRLLLGSVADKVICGSSMPILVHRPLA